MNKELKITALLFLILANAGILTHAVICHHHINRFYNAAHCDHTPCQGDIEDCSLTNIYVKSCKCCQTFLPHNCDFELLPKFFTLFSDYSIPQIKNDTGLPFRQNPYFLSYHFEHISQSLGLRAPPAC